VPISFDHETDTVEVALGEGDICVGLKSTALSSESTLALSALGQSCCISTPLDKRLDNEDLEGEQVKITIPKTPEGLNSARVVLKGVLGLVTSIQNKLLDENIEIETPEGLQECAFCANTKKTSVTEFYGGIFVCQLCSTHLYVAATDPNNLSLQERHNISMRTRQLEDDRAMDRLENMSYVPDKE